MRQIDADALLEEIEDWHDSLGGTMNPADWGIQNVLQSVMDNIIEAPDIDAEPVRHGRWIESNKHGWAAGQYFATPRLVCPFCNQDAAHYSVEHAEHGGRVTTIHWIRTDCCPHCGAKMDLPHPTDNEKEAKP